jgi:hypothetical protein
MCSMVYEDWRSIKDLNDKSAVFPGKPDLYKTGGYREIMPFL